MMKHSLGCATSYERFTQTFEDIETFLFSALGAGWGEGGGRGAERRGGGALGKYDLKSSLQSGTNRYIPIFQSCSRHSMSKSPTHKRDEYPIFVSNVVPIQNYPLQP